MSDAVERYDDEIDLRAYLEVLWRRKWVLVGMVALVTAAAYGFTQTMEPVYEAEATVLVRSDVPGLGVVDERLQSPALSTETALEMLRSRQLAQTVAARLLEAGELDLATVGPGSVDLWVQERVSAQRVGNTPMVRIEAEATAPETAAALANAMVRSLDEAMMQATQADLRAAVGFTTEQLARVRQDLDRLEGEASRAPAAGGDLERERRVLEELYASLLRQQEELRMRLAVQSSPLQVIDAAVRPTEPVRPRLGLNVAVAVVLGGFLGLALVFVLEFFDVRIRSPQQLEEIMGAPVLTQVPRETLTRWRKREASTQEGIPTQADGRAAQGGSAGAARSSDERYARLLAGEGSGRGTTR